MASSQPTTGRGRGSIKKTTPTTRRVWTNREEKILLIALKDLVSNGWKSNNGFRTGFLKKLEEALKKEYPNTDLVASPNITSKLTIIKKIYSSLVTAHGVTGVGVNMTTMQLECTDEQWEEVLKNDPTMRGMRYKKWTHYSDWVEIFGKDRATGQSAEDVTDMANKVHTPETVPINNPQSEYDGNNYEATDDQTNVNKQNTQMNDEQDENNTAYIKRSTQTSKGAGNKRKFNQVATDPAHVKILGDFCRNTSERLVAIANQIGYGHDLGSHGKKLYEELGEIQGLSIHDKIHVAHNRGQSRAARDVYGSVFGSTGNICNGHFGT